MTEKEVTKILYQNIKDASRIEIKSINNKNFYIFKGGLDNEYMVCELDQGIGNSCSGVLKTITECYDWINQK